MKQIALAIVSFIAVSIIVTFAFQSHLFTPQNNTSHASQTFVDTNSGIAFNYPVSYALTERNVDVQLSTSSTSHRVIRIVRVEDSGTSSAELPIAITIDIFKKNATTTASSLKDWLLNDPDSNFHLSDGTFATTTYLGSLAYVYKWSGLYQGITTLTLQRNMIIAASVTFNSTTDPIVAAYQSILNSIHFQ